RAEDRLQHRADFVAAQSLDGKVVHEAGAFEVGDEARESWARLFTAVRERDGDALRGRSEEHTSELQSLRHFVCRLLLEKKNANAPCFVFAQANVGRELLGVAFAQVCSRFVPPSSAPHARAFVALGDLVSVLLASLLASS